MLSTKAEEESYISRSKSVFSINKQINMEHKTQNEGSRKINIKDIIYKSLRQL